MQEESKNKSWFLISYSVYRSITYSNSVIAYCEKTRASMLDQVMNKEIVSDSSQIIILSFVEFDSKIDAMMFWNN